MIEATQQVAQQMGEPVDCLEEACIVTSLVLEPGRASFE